MIANNNFPIEVRPAKKIPVPIKQIQEKFWTNSSGSFRLSAERLHDFLKKRGYGTYRPKNVKTVILVKVENKIIKQVSSKDIRAICWKYINEYSFSDPDERRQIKDEFQRNRSFFSKDNLDLLPLIEIEEIRDTKDKCYLFFNDCVFEITKEKIMVKDYSEMEGFVFETDVNRVNMRTVLQEYQKEISNIPVKGDFSEFVKDLCRNDNNMVSANSLESLTTIIGYLVHRYKGPTNAKAIVFMDTYKDGNPNGGTGKGLLCKGLGAVRISAYQDGKFFKSSDKFVFSNVEYGTRLMVIDDVPKDFNFERIFPIITEKILVERKYENKFEIPFEESPKVIITTNYTVEGSGNSHNRRKIEFVLSDYYRPDYDPEDKFGRLLYSSEWDEAEWCNFYLFISHCVREFLKKGIIEPKFNVAERKLKMEATKEFIDFVNTCVNPAEKTNKANLYELFYTKYPSHHKIEMTTFRSWLKYFADAYDFRFIESHSGNDNFFEYAS